MGSFVIVLIVIVCVLLALVILVQNPKGGGLASGFQGATQIGGVQKTTDFLEKSTWYLTIALFVLCVWSASFYSPSAEDDSAIDDIELIDQGDVPTEEAAPVNEEAPAE